jgi:hypothetical protein
MHKVKGENKMADGYSKDSLEGDNVMTVRVTHSGTWINVRTNRMIFFDQMIRHINGGGRIQVRDWEEVNPGYDEGSYPIYKEIFIDDIVGNF